MANPGFGPLTVIRNGFSFTVPSERLTRQGNLRKDIRRMIKRCSTVADATLLRLNGIDVTKA
jgi:hypothetical protein